MSRTNPDYVSAPFECAGHLNGIDFILSVNMPPTGRRGLIWVRLSDRVPYVFLNRKWHPVEITQTWKEWLSMVPE